jgi:hypothetical protein
MPNERPKASVGRNSRSEKDYRDKDVCITGKILDYHGKPEIVVTDPTKSSLKGSSRGKSPRGSYSDPRR